MNLLEKKQIVQVKEIAEELKMSKRTILSDLNEIRSHFEDSVEISGSNRGIELIINDYSIYHFKKQVYIRQEPLIQIIEGIYSGECLNYVEWAEKISLSESTILRLLKKLKKIVKPYRINLSFSPVQFIGKELDARKFFWDLYCESSFIEIYEVPNGHQKQLIELFLLDGRFISVKRIKNILNLSLGRAGIGKIEFDYPVSELAILDHLFVPLFLELRKISCLSHYSNSVLFKEATFIFLMLYSHWNQSNSTKIPLIDISSTCGKFCRSIVSFLSQKRMAPIDNELETTVMDFLSRQYTKICLGETYLKNTEENNKFAQSLNPILYNELCDFLNNKNDLPSYFQNAFIPDFSASLLLYLFVNNVIFNSEDLLILLSNDSVIDESARIVFENFFNSQATILYEEDIQGCDLRQQAYNKIITNIVPFNYDFCENTKIIHFSKLTNVGELIQFATALQS
ncbi:hypothetical protein RV18_GL001543 [Enterococcus termitis]|nr:hypothetical protein RV18_GL001543 [Enterococcus termitis]